MNIVSQYPKDTQYYVVCVEADGGKYVVHGKRVSEDGSLLSVGDKFRYETRVEAERKARELSKTKRKRKKCRQCPMEEVPPDVMSFCVAPEGSRVTPSELRKIVEEAKDERYVVFKDVSGMEEYFDAGIEYVGSITDDPDVILVCDKLGEVRNCFVERMESVILTETALEVKDKGISSYMKEYLDGGEGQSSILQRQAQSVG